MIVKIDRFEENIAILELPDMSTVSASRALFDGANEGDKVEINIIGKSADDKQRTHELFERLRKNRHD